MLIEEALRLRQNWAIKGSPPCTHPTLDKERLWGKFTGNYICTVCGKSYTYDEWERELKKREKEIKSILDLWSISRLGRSSKGIIRFQKWCAKLYTLLS